jgi:hypothetical protein
MEERASEEREGGEGREEERAIGDRDSRDYHHPARDVTKWCINTKAEELYQEDTLAQAKDATVLIQTTDTLCVEGEYFILIASLWSHKCWCW